MRMDPKLVAGKQRHEVTYLGRKYRIDIRTIKKVLKKYGRSRKKVIKRLKRIAARQRRERRHAVQH